MELVRISYLVIGGKMSAMHKHHIPCSAVAVRDAVASSGRHRRIDGRFIAMILD